MEIRKITLSVVCGVSLLVAPLAGRATDEENRITADEISSMANKNVKTRVKETPATAINETAQTAKKENKLGQVLSYALAAAEGAFAAYNVPPCAAQNYGACANVAIFSIMALQSLQQGQNHGSTAGAARITANATDGYGNSDAADKDTMGEKVETSHINASKAIKALTEQGVISKDRKTVKTPDGKSYKVADMTSAAAMQAAGLPKASIDEAMANYAKMEKKAMEKLKIGAQTAANGYAEGGGGSGSSGAASEEDPSLAYAAASSGVGKSALARDPSSLAAGMSKNYNGEPIGVAADSIFLMMNRRYKVKESQDSFFGINDILLKK